MKESERRKNTRVGFLRPVRTTTVLSVQCGLEWVFLCKNEDAAAAFKH